MTQADKNVSRFALIAAFGGFVFGLDAANISGAVRYISSLFELDSIQVGTLVGCALIGVIVALFITGKLCDKFGRKKVLLGIAFTYALSSIISSLAVNYEMLVVGRFIGGVAFASITVSAMYIGEIASPDKRGRYVSVNQLMIAVGLLLAFVINYFLIKALPTVDFLSNDNIWRYMLGAELIANAVWIVLLVGIPESPRWLVSKSREVEAKQSLHKLADATQVNTIYTEIEESLSHHHNEPVFKQLKSLFSKRMSAVVILAVVYAIVQGATGMNAVLFFAPMVFEQIGMSVEDTFVQTITMGLIGVVSTVIAICFVEKLGRRFLTLAGLLLVAVAHIAIWQGFKLANYKMDEVIIVEIKQELAGQSLDLNKLDQFVGQRFKNDVELKTKLAQVFDKKELPIVSGPVINQSIQDVNGPIIIAGIFLFLAAFNMSIGPIMWVIFSEIFPNSVRSVALPFAALVQTISSWSIQQFFPWQLENLGTASTFLNYGVLAIIGLAVLWFILPETKGKSIEALEKQLIKAE
ncbi:MFS transporter [Gayadomonas joobiniege]|uniref:MFS transporter n=1 Tax=Gayadomonas joobiniege TaxID=1234606 RepID=UPI00036B89AE|nr:MFS transporter [Gayadomonas joobiniege]